MDASQIALKSKAKPKSQSIGKRSPEVQERRLKVLQLRTSGASLRAIAIQLNVSFETARKDLHAALASARQEVATEAENLRQLELIRIDTALFAIDQQVRKGNFGAIDRMLRLIQERSKLLGLYPTQKLEVKQDEEQFEIIARLTEARDTIQQRLKQLAERQAPAEVSE